jgi:hypothetical protein
MDKVHFTTIARFMEITPAQVAQNLLREAGIRSFLGDAETITTDWMLSNALGGIKLKVADEDVERARELLRHELNDEERAALVQEALDAADEDTEEGAQKEDELEPQLNAREELAQKTYRGSLLCLMVPPFYFVILWMLYQVWKSSEPLGQSYRKQVWIATAITLPWVFLMGCVGFVMLMPY